MINYPLLDGFIFGMIVVAELITNEYALAVLSVAAFSLHWYRKLKK